MRPTAGQGRASQGWAVTVATCAALAGCVAARPTWAEATSAERLLHDVSVLVAGKSQRGWEIDRFELDTLLPAFLESYCRTGPDSRAAALAEATQVRQAAGADVASELAKVQGNTAEIAELLLAERRLHLLRRADTASAADCPATLRPHARFLGRQTLADRSVLHVDGGGLVTLRNSDRGLNYGGGGSGRFMAGRSWNTRWATLTGFEIGGAALLDQTLAQEGQPQLRLHLFAAWPFVVRRSWQQWHVDIDVAPVAQFSSDLELRGVGGKAGALLTVSTARILNTIPWAGLGVSVEHMIGAEAGRLNEWTVRGGFRVGFDLDFGAAGRDRAAWQPTQPN